MAKSLFENVLKNIQKKEDNSAEQPKTAESFSAQNKEDTQKSTDEDLATCEEVTVKNRKDSTGLLSVNNSSPKSLFEKTSVDLSGRYKKYGENFLNKETAKALTEITDDKLIAKRKGSSHPRRVFYLTRDAAMKETLKGNCTYYLKVCDYNGKLRKFDVRDKNLDLLGVRPIILIKRKT